jgi:Zn-dependent protease
MLVSLAGPLSNFGLAILAAIPIRLGLVSLAGAFTASRGILPTPGMFLIEFMWINLVLMLFNLLPIAPLDGDKIAEYFFPPAWARVLQNIRPYGPIILISLLFIGPFVFRTNIIFSIIGPPLQALMRILVG